MKEEIKKFYSRVARGEENNFQKIGSNDVEILRHMTDPHQLLSLGCGYPLKFVEFRGDEKILELGAGGGINCFLASEVSNGIVVGLDFSIDMVTKAKRDMERAGKRKVKFIAADAEKSPFKRESFDIIFTNCVMNLTNKTKVLGEMWRILKPDGRALLSEIISNKPIPKQIKDKIEMWVSCLAGATTEQALLEKIRENNLEIVNLFEKTKLLELKEEELTFYKIIREIRKPPS